MPEVFVAAGSNVEAEKNIRRAVELLRAAWPEARFSAPVRSTAAGFDGDDFINFVVGFHTDLPLAAVLARLHAIEAQCGRERAAPKWAPRSMDLDVLLYGDAVGEFPGAILPRPDLLRRAYMLGPLAELAGEVVHPSAGKTIGALWRDFDRGAHPLHRLQLTWWPPAAGTDR
jgi:2-amino-4-hydroxy-6-hydroxymethyldihydropteridine diphosphokinase